VPLSGDQSPKKRGIDWPAILRILLMQMLVLLALTGAFVRYVDWSSDRALAEFGTASKASAPKRQPPSQAPIQNVKDKAPCARRA
jgi:hypothetical protein